MYVEYPLYGIEQTWQGKPMVLSGSPASIANRVSYFFNFNGPSLAVDTMCSSSLTTIHLACQSIRQGECEVAIAGGVNVSIHPNKYLILAHGKFASSKGLCESFGQGGDGYVPGEGVGAVLLKPLDKAIADGDHIYGVIKGTTVNHGGKTNGYTVPNPNAQAEVVASTLKEAGIDPRAVSYIEAHGTGTALGDPIEVTGLTKAFGEYTSEKGFCALGSVKSNIGHCEGAAGIAGVTKVLLQMKHGQLAPSLHAKELNINIDFENTPFKVQQELTEWKRPLISANGQTREYPRIAGVSSFGAGGANAHILIQEYIPVTPPVSIPVTAQQPAIIVLSAKNAERLNEQAQQLLNFIKENPVAEQVLSNIAYTLQVGREAMDERLALVVESVEQLQDKLQAFLQEQEDVEGLYRGQVKRSKETLSIFTGDEDLQQAIYAWMSKGKYGKLLELWVKGLVLDWDKLYTTNKPHRISLPTYPFARDRYWAPEAATSASNTSVQSVLHPLVHQNTSDFTVQRFSSTFTGQEFFLTDHVVNGQKMLPGVAYLEMAQAAIRKAISAKEEYTLGLKLKNVVWNQPFVVSEQAEQLHIRLSLEENAQVTYEIYSEAKSDQSVLFCQGRTELTNTIDSAFLDLDSLQKECNQRTFSALQCYEAFQQMGLRYGASHQGLQMVYASADQVLAKLALPASVTATQQTFVLHPSLLDSALQASIGLMMYRNELQPALPFAVQEVEIIDSCTSSMWAWVRYSEGSQAGDKVQKLDIDVCNEQGKVCVRIKQFSVRVLTVAAESKASQKVIDTLLLAPKWTSQDASIPTDDVSYAKQVVVLCELDQTLGQTIEAYYTYTQCLVFSTVEQNIYTRFEMYATALFKQIQSLIQGKPKGKILVQVVVPVQAEKQLLAGLAGMLKTAQQEHPKFVGQLIEIEELDAVSILTRLNNDSLYPSVSHIRYQGGRRLVCTWTQVQPATTVTMPWKEEGVYLITGGLGGLGALFANEIARRAKRPTLILTGRSLLNSAKRAQLEALDALGATVRYVPLDIANSQAVSNLMHSIEQEFGRLDGVLHSAGIIQDSFILKKTTQQVEEVLAPKVAGLVNLDQASKHFNLDFLILFSSVAGAIGSAGQADYATGNAFMDAYANYRNALVASGQRQGHTLSINWPLWKEGGMQVNQATEQLLWQNMGMVAMPTATGIQAFYQAFNSRKDQVMVLAGDGGQLKQFMKLETGLQGGYDLVEKELTVDYDEFYQAILEKIAKGELSEDEFEKVVTQ
jgi:polyketide synthase PksN